LCSAHEKWIKIWILNLIPNESAVDSGQSTVGNLNLLFTHKLIDIQPMDKGVKPTVARTVGIAEAKTVSSVLVQVKFHRPTCLVPRLDDSKLPLE
jgi:hypothetical protein